jgi:hypothetical protein
MTVKVGEISTKGRQHPTLRYFVNHPAIAHVPFPRTPAWSQ